MLVLDRVIGRAIDKAFDRAAVRPRVGSLVPGTIVVAAIAAAATAIGGVVPVIGAPVVAIVLGIALALVRRPGARLAPGIAFASRRVLQASIVVLGFGLSLGQVLSTGARSLPVLIGTLVVALGAAWLAGRALGLRGDARTLIGVGTAICGASAIAATNAVISADDADVSYSIATIFTFNVAAVLLYPTIGHALGLSQHSFGLWAGTAINDVSSVVAASTIYGHAAASYGVVVKLTRTLAIIPICLGLTMLRARRPGTAGSTDSSIAGADSSTDSSIAGADSSIAGAAAGKGRIALWQVFPVFIIGFIAAVVVNTVGLVPQGWHHGVSNLSTWMITAALAAIGLSTDAGSIRRAGFRPLALGAVLWLTVGLTSLGLQALTGTL